MEIQEPLKYVLRSQVGQDQFETVQSGELFPIDDNLAETKSFWNGSPNYLNPEVLFVDSEGLFFELHLKRTEKGFSATGFYDGYKLGCNLNRVRNQKRRWGLTVWVERLASDKKAS